MYTSELYGNTIGLAIHIGNSSVLSIIMYVLQRSMMNNDLNEFWKDVKKNTNSNVSSANNVDGSIGDSEFAEMWKCHYKSPLNSVQNEELQNPLC